MRIIALIDDADVIERILKSSRMGNEGSVASPQPGAVTRSVPRYTCVVKSCVRTGGFPAQRRAGCNCE
jgi:hypothetical protein